MEVLGSIPTDLDILNQLEWVFVQSGIRIIYKTKMVAIALRVYSENLHFFYLPEVVGMEK